MHRLIAIALTVTLALSPVMGAAFGDGAALAAPKYHKFCEKPMKPPELKAKMERSLAIDPSGNRKLEGCRANPRDFLDAWENEINTPKTVAGLPEFVGRFTEIDVPAGQKIYSSGMRTDGNGVVRRAVERAPHANEAVYGIGDEPYLMEDCTNPINMTVDAAEVMGSPCVEVTFPAWIRPKDVGGGAVRIAYIAAEGLPGKCLELSGPGVPNGSQRGIPTECKDDYTKFVNGRKVRVVCDWTDAEAEVSRLLGVKSEVQNVSGSFFPRANGRNTLKLPREAMDGITAICWEFPDGTFIAVGVTRDDFVNNVATITSKHIAESLWVVQ